MCTKHQKLFPARTKKTNTIPQLYGTILLSTYIVCKTTSFFPPEQKTDTTAQLEMKKGSSSPREVSVTVEPLRFIYYTNKKPLIRAFQWYLG